MSNRYNREAVDQAIASSNRAGRRIGGREAKKIHALLKGWRGSAEEKADRERQLVELAAKAPQLERDQDPIDGLALFDVARNPKLI